MWQIWNNLSDIGAQQCDWSVLDRTRARDEVELAEHQTSVASDELTDQGHRCEVVGPGDFSQSTSSFAIHHFLTGNIDSRMMDALLENANMLYCILCFCVCYG
jgi:hypothetical protein